MGIVGDQRDPGMQCTYFHEGSYFDSEGAEEGIWHLSSLVSVLSTTGIGSHVTAVQDVGKARFGVRIRVWFPCCRDIDIKLQMVQKIFIAPLNVQLLHYVSGNRLPGLGYHWLGCLSYQNATLYIYLIWTPSAIAMFIGVVDQDPIRSLRWEGKEFKKAWGATFSHRGWCEHGTSCQKM